MIRTGVLYSCIGKGGLYSVLDFPKSAGASKVFEDIVIYEDIRTQVKYWRFKSDFEDRMEVVSGENTEETIRSQERH